MDRRGVLKMFRVRRWPLWLSMVVLLGCALGYGLLHFVDLFAKQWAERFFSEQAIASDIDLRWVGLSGADIASITLNGEGFEARGEEISLRWRALELLNGKLESVEIGAWAMDIDLTERDFFSALERISMDPEPTAPALIRASLLPKGPAFNAIEPQPKWLTRWWNFPVAQIELPSLSVKFDFGDHVADLAMGLRLTTTGRARQLFSSGNGTGYDFQFAVDDEPLLRTWKTRFSWSGIHLLRVWDDFFPADRAYSLKASLGAWLLDWDAEMMEIEALAEGEGETVSAFSVLLEQGPFRARLKNDIELQTNALSAGLTLRENRIQQAEVVAGFDYISLLGGQTRPMQAKVSRIEGGPIRIELPSVRWARAGEMEVDFAMRAFWEPEDATGEVQLSVSKAAIGSWSLRPFRWFTSWSAGLLVGRVSGVALERFPDWKLIDTRFEELEANAFSFSANLECIPIPGRFLRFSGHVNPVANPDAPSGELEIRDGKEVLLGSIRGEVEGDVFNFEGAGSFPLDTLRQLLEPFFDKVDSLQAEGDLAWDLTGGPHFFLPFQGGMKLSLTDGGLFPEDKRWLIEGLMAQLSFRVIGPFPASKGVQEIQIAKLSSGQNAIEDVTLQFDWRTRDQLKIVKVEGEWMGGRVSMDPFELRLREPLTVQTIVRFDGIEAGRLLNDAGQMGFSLDARLNGSIPMTYSLGKQPTVSQGTLRLRSVEEAKPVLRDSLRMAGFIGLPDVANIRARVAKAIESDFRIHSLEVSLFDTAYPGQPIRAVLEGSVMNEDVEIPEFRIVQSHQVETALEGWQALLFFFSGGTWSPDRD